MQIRPFIEMRVGQINLPLRVPISPLLVDAPTTTLAVNTTAGASSLDVSNVDLFFAPYPILIGEPGNETSEIVYISGVSGSTFSLSGTTLFPHSSSTNIYLLIADEIEISHSDIVNGSKTVLANLSITANITTDYNDTVSTGGFYFARYFQNFAGNIVTVSANNDGASYVVGDILTLTNGDGNATVRVTTIDMSGAVTGVEIVNRGSGYAVATSPTTGGSGDTNATIDVDSINLYSPYSDDVPYEGYTIRSARSVIDSALNEINKQESQTLTDEFAFQQLDNCQTEIIQDLKRWSFMQLFDVTVGHTDTGSWKFTLPDNIGVDNSNKSIYQLRVATQQRLVWVDKQKFDEFLVGVAYTTLAAPAVNMDTTLTLVDSTSFNSLASQTQDGSGTVTIGANTYGYSANDTTTGILTLTDAITTDTVAPIGADVFQGATQGLPNYWTTYGGIAYYWPIASQSYNGFQLLMDYYTRQVKITSDSDILVIPDATVAIAYLCWKFLKKLSNGDDTPASLSYMNQYLSRKEKMRIKEVMNRTFKFRPRIQNFAVQSEFNESTPRWVRDAEFPNTGF
ncbi:MAG: hypothetical protein V4436_02240 [Patescibacteria group bacterium]